MLCFLGLGLIVRLAQKLGSSDFATLERDFNILQQQSWHTKDIMATGQAAILQIRATTTSPKVLVLESPALGIAVTTPSTNRKHPAVPM